ncbi:MAG: hypothetical protein RL227_2477 [Pseudomonadota bacterium]|jgi:hypothetical protein
MSERGITDALTLNDVLELAEAMNARRGSDERFIELLGELSTSLAEITELMEQKAKSPEAAPALDVEAVGKAIAAAIVAGLRSMPAQAVTVQAPALQGTDWSRIEIDLNRDAFGRIGDRLTLTRN